MHRPVLLSLAILAAWWAAAGRLSVARADRCGIRLVGVNVHEPAQRAILAHDGSRELLILQTDIRADKDTTLVGRGARHEIDGSAISGRTWR